MKNHREPWTKAELQALKKHSKEGTPMKRLAKEFGRTQAALRAQAHKLGIGLGQQQWRAH